MVENEADKPAGDESGEDDDQNNEGRLARGAPKKSGDARRVRRPGRSQHIGRGPRTSLMPPALEIASPRRAAELAGCVTASQAVPKRGSGQT